MPLSQTVLSGFQITPSVFTRSSGHRWHAEKGAVSISRAAHDDHARDHRVPGRGRGRGAARDGGRDAGQLAQEWVDDLIEYDSWYRQKVAEGRAQLDRGEFLTHEEVSARLARLFQS